MDYYVVAALVVAGVVIIISFFSERALRARERALEERLANANERLANIADKLAERAERDRYRATERALELLALEHVLVKHGLHPSEVLTEAEAWHRKLMERYRREQA